MFQIKWGMMLALTPFAVNQGPNLLLQPFDLWNWDARPGTPTLTTVTAGSHM